ncbi:hypothetical protein [Sporocytophaga myxococcoides]|nr:hypothetical protein [Sporocytophaga myxococcoides]
MRLDVYYPETFSRHKPVVMLSRIINDKDMIDPDKKVEKDKAKKSNLYKSSQQPDHFENEGGEYIEAEPNKRKNDEFKDDDKK